jgi:hypothetical protein
MTQKYRLNILGWYNFERLVQTLLKAAIGVGVTSFGGSKDKGRDATFKGSANYPNKNTRWSGYWVFQVKYMDYEELPSKDAQSRLRSELCEEMKKIIKKNRKKPDNYILITNISVSSENRDKLDDIALGCGFIENYATIDGEDISQFLDIFPEIRRTFPQLLGLADLKLLINLDIYNRSRMFFNDWTLRMEKFVQTDAYFESFTKLNTHNFVVIDGPPEVGKSMIAAACAFVLSSEGYTVYDIRIPEDLLKIFDSSERQLFIADDAVGSISYDPGLTNNWSREFSKIFGSLDKDHKLIWTARSYILTEAVHESRIGENIKEFPGIHEILVEVSDLTILQKAEILYNHAKFGNLNESAKKIIKENAERIVTHKNFTPEKIRQLINDFIPPFYESNNDEGLLEWKKIDGFLNNPSEHWKKAYSKLNLSEKILLSSMLDFDRFPNIDSVKKSYDRRRLNAGEETLPFEESFERVDHSFLKTEKMQISGIIIDFQHPIIRDLLITNLQNDDQALLKHIELASPNAIAEIIRGFSKGYVESENIKHLISLKNKDHIEKLLQRIEKFSDSILSVSEWYSILSALETLVPSEKYDLHKFSSSNSGMIIGQTLKSFGSKNSYDHSKSYSIKNWHLLITKYYSLSRFVFPPPRNEYIHLIALKLKTEFVEYKTLFNLISLIQNYEPILYEQMHLDDKIPEIDETLRENLTEKFDDGEIFLEPWGPNELREYNDWASEVVDLLSFTEEFYNWCVSLEKPQSEIARLDSLFKKIRPADNDENDDVELSEEIDTEYWTISRLFEDL